MIFSTQSFAKHILLIVSSFILMSKILIIILFQYDKMDRIEVKYQWLFIQLNKLFYLLTLGRSLTLNFIRLRNLWLYQFKLFKINLMLNKGRFEQKWVFFFKIKVIYMIMYELFFSLKALSTVKLLVSLTLTDAFSITFVVCSHPQTIYRNFLLSHSHIKYNLLI